MPSESLPPLYSSKDVESRWYKLWESKGYFRPQSDREGKKFRDSRYVVVIPPPNVTGILHMGHALNNSIQDILVRWYRMMGSDTLWVPGVDHAGIATQNVVEKKLAKGKKSRQALGREKFLKEVWKWKEEHGSTITRQLRRLGASCDWSRERFTMDEGLSRAVREAFVTLYERGLIYQGNYIINWCPRCQTALSDEETAHKEVEGGLYHIQYPVAKPLTPALSPKRGEGESKFPPSPKRGEGESKVPPSPKRGEGESKFPLSPQGRGKGEGMDHIVVATTRPETMLGDTAVAVNPEDKRYRHLIGKKLILPLIEREIPVIADSFVDPEFGTGLVKVTPAHDPNDFEMGLRHNLPQVNVMNPDGTINENGGRYRGLDRFEARKKIVADLQTQGLFVRRDSHRHAVGHCYRCDTVVEPYLSKQWFVKMKPLAAKALAAHRARKTQFYPDRWTKVYTNWLEGIRDWCISRQIWWGHQIPVWYCEKCLSLRATKGSQAISDSEIASSASPPRNDSAVIASSEGAKPSQKGIIVSRETPKKCPDCEGNNLIQDPDVLDTWFSSWLWPFSTLGWPEKTEDLKYFYPTSDLITAPEIIFFWVARMIIAGLEFMGEVPFSKIYIHGTVRAQTGLKMSKSLGNAIDPIEVIDEIGADALRFSMVMLSAQDVYLSREKFEVGRNFTNKIWNAARFVLMNLEGFDEGCVDPKLTGFARANFWIIVRLEKTILALQDDLSTFNMSQAAAELYHFVWNDFCDWFIELAKPNLSPDSSEKKMTQAVLFFVLEKTLRLLHPFMPFITEEIWQKLRGLAKDQERWPVSIVLAPWPEFPKRELDRETELEFDTFQKVVTGIRDLRTALHIAPVAYLMAVVRPREKKIAEALSGVPIEKEIRTLARLKEFRIDAGFRRTQSYVGNSFPDFEVYIYIEGLVDAEKERARIERKLAETRSWLEALRKRLSNQDFVKNAPEAIVQREKEMLQDAEKLLRSHQDNLALFQ